ncbi:unnamed protein product [Clonostachys rhizophaga]|uniref:Major facilitator superfamily (MFS) profile domain-containing protein n=1 Tax=Clonostachys rhizophaga TaxID=160324 RepID=A0A9N9YHY6_9HYPO|nr:unnamed protein product [Clonostachys rhizophaga]
MTSEEFANPRRSCAGILFDAMGLDSLYRSAPDVKLLCAQRFVRLFAYGASTLVLVSFLRELQTSQTLIGLFMTLTLGGDIAISFLLALFADGMGRRATLALGAILMTASGLVFASSDNYWILLAAAILGVISPSGNEIGPFRAVEESIIAHLNTSTHLSDIYAWYSLSGTAGTAFGIVTCGWVIHHLHQVLSKPLLEAYRLVFVAYSAVGVVKFVLVLLLSRAVEAEVEAEEPTQSETAPLLGEREESTKPAQTRRTQTRRSLLPNVSKHSIPVVVSLCILFALDAFASGLAPLSWVTYFFKSHYNIEEGRLGSIFFVTSIISACSTIVASFLAKRFGNVKTMVFTHLPSAVFLALIPIPNDAHWSILFLALRACTQSMDVAPRSAFLATILQPQERTVILGLVNVVKTSAQSMGPLITGVLADSNYFYISFVCAGSLKACYDLGLLAVFKNHEADRKKATAKHDPEE